MRIAVLPGDDIGPEIVDAALAVLRTADEQFALGLSFDVHEVGMVAHRRCGTTLPDSVVEAARQADGLILGPGGMTAYPPASEGGINIAGTIRKRLDLYANLRPARSRPFLPRSISGLDCMIVRENTEGFYADRTMFQGYGEFMPTPDSALAVRKITAQASRRIAKVAFRYAEQRRRSVTVVGKRHVLQMSDGLFVREVEAEAALHSSVSLREMDVDAMAAELYLRPEQHDVILTTNMFGDILSNEAAALSGGLGLAAALNVGDAHAAANAGHGSAPDIAAQDKANPAAMILSSALLLRWLAAQHHRSEFDDAAKSIEDAVEATLQDSSSRTVDLGGKGGTRSFGSAVRSALRARAPVSA